MCLYYIPSAASSSNLRLLTPLLLHILTPKPPSPYPRRTILRLSSQLLERNPLRLGNKQRQEASQQHEESVNLHDVVLPRVGGRSRGAGGGTPGAQRRDGRLGDDGAELA
jgi:hypothetical protein